MTVKQHTPSGAQRSTSARTNRPATRDRPKNAAASDKKGKAEKQREADELTAGRVRDILADPKTSERVKDKLHRAISGLAEWVNPTVAETPEFYAQQFEDSAINLHDADTELLFVRKGTPFYARAVALAERHEPRAHKVARRCVEIYFQWLGRKKGRKYADGAYYFIEHVDAVLEGGEDGLLPNPDSKYFTPLFVEAWNERGPRDRKVRRLLDLIKRVDEGADLNQLRDEAHRNHAERAAAHRPKDALLVNALSKVIADPKREDDHITILDDINNLSNHTVGVSDFHPEIFPTLARVIIREARKQARGRSRLARDLRRYLGRLEAVAAGE